MTPRCTAAPAAPTAPPQARATRDLELYLLALFGCERRGALIEVHHRDGGELRRAFFAHRDTFTAARTIARLAIAGDVHVGAAPRRRRRGAGEEVERVWSLWAELEQPDARARLELLPCAPSIVVAAGAARVHAYWLLRSPVDAAVAEEANRRLAAQLGADGGAVTSATAMLRPPGTYCFASTPPAPVVLERLRSAMTTVQAVTAGLARDPAAALAPAPALARPIAPIAQEALPV
ncbi:MAG: RepB DNA-primase from phage plasmid [Solirubrobacteraceae bacterium]|nr:RepB DNA-primase from phage plasmid [Solirubrobacteraceae bacterium]